MMVRAALLLLSVALSLQAHGFGGTIAIGLGQANQVETVSVPFKASARLETEEHTIAETIYYTPGKLRDDMSMGGENMVAIRRFDLKKSWMLMPQNLYMESALDDPNDQMEDYKLIEKDVLGREVVNGEQTTKHKVIYQGKKGRYGGFTWFTDDNIAVKAFLISEEHGEKQRIQYEMTSVTRGPQPDSLFEIPPGYARFDMPNMGDMATTMGGAAASGAAGSAMGQPGLAAAMGQPGVAEAMASAMTGRAAPTATATTGAAATGTLTGDQQLILQIQQDLTTLGYDPDPPSGQLGTKTQLAIGKFESDHGLPFTGQPTFELAVQIRNAMSGAGAAAGATAPATAGPDPVLAAQQACLDEAVKRQKQKKRWGALTNAGARLAARFGGAKVASDVYNTTATANDVSTIANELGISEADVQRCIDEANAGR